MNIVIDACSVILLSKAGVIGIFSKWHNIAITNQAYDEVMKGKEKKFEDAFAVEKLCNEKTIKKADLKNDRLSNIIQKDFGFGEGESTSVAYAIKSKFAILTDNKQARKAARIYGLKLIGSPEVVVGLFKANKISGDKTLSSLEALSKTGWFESYIIDKAKEEMQDDK